MTSRTRGVDETREYEKVTSSAIYKTKDNQIGLGSFSVPLFKERESPNFGRPFLNRGHFQTCGRVRGKKKEHGKT